MLYWTSWRTFVTVWQWPYATSWHVFPSGVAFLFSQRSYISNEGVRHASQRSSVGLRSGLCGKNFVSCFPERLWHSISPGESWHCHPEHTWQKSIDGKPAHSPQSGSQLTSVFGNIMLLNLDLTNWSNPRSHQWTHTVYTRHNGRMTSPTCLLTVMCLSLWTSVNLDSADHTTLSPGLVVW